MMQCRAQIFDNLIRMMDFHQMEFGLSPADTPGYLLVVSGRASGQNCSHAAVKVLLCKWACQRECMAFKWWLFVCVSAMLTHLTFYSCVLLMCGLCCKWASPFDM